MLINKNNKLTFCGFQPKPFNGFGSKPKKNLRLQASVTLDPFRPIPVEHDIIRSSDLEDLLCLENNGLLQLNLKFSVADGKSLGILSKSRQFSSLFKINCSEFRKILNGSRTNGPTSVLLKQNNIGVNDVIQEFSGIFDNIPLVVTIAESEWGSNMSTQEDTFAKVLVHKFFEAYQEHCAQLPKSNPQYKEKRGTKLFLIKDYLKFFGVDEAATVQVSEPFPPNIADIRGRVFKKKQNDQKNGENEQDQAEPMRVFNAFATMPNSLTIVNDPERKRDLFTAEPIELKSLLDPETATKHTLLLKSRLTTYQIVPLKSESIEVETPRMVFSFFEDSVSFERVFVSPNFLAACLHKELLHYISKTHSSRII